jgi:DMSO/TMAO reductase YedYZ molybdopterin-dependent catalytic subunit
MHKVNRRAFLGTSAAVAGATMLGGLGRLGAAQAASAAAELTPGVPVGVASYVTMGKLPGKKPLIQLSDRPPNYEAPIEYFRTPITPNDQFFVRYHLANIPQIAPQEWRLRVGGDAADKPYDLTLAQLRSEFAPVEVGTYGSCKRRMSTSIRSSPSGDFTRLWRRVRTNSGVASAW